MDETSAVQRGRQAARRYAWSEACEAFDAADAEGALEPADLSAYAWASWLAGRVAAFGPLLERSYAGFIEQDDPRNAALVALDLVRYHGGRGSRSLATGWLRRAEHHLKDHPESAEYGRLLVIQAFLAQLSGDLDKAKELAQTVVDRGRQMHDGDLLALGLNRMGRIRIKLGEVAEGNALMDEAMAGVVGGECSVITSGIVYCSTIDGCVDVSDFGRAGEWVNAAERWCEGKSMHGFPGICRVHRAEILRVKGDLPGAEQEVRRACDELEQQEMVNVASAGHYELGEILLRLGDMRGAEAAFRRADEMGHSPQPGLSLLQLADGKARAAWSSIRRALDDREDKLARTRLLPAAVEIAVAAGDLDAAAEAVDELKASAEGYGTEALLATADVACGRLSLARDDVRTASRCLRGALRRWQRLDLPYEAARTRVLLASAYRREGDEDGAREELLAACKVFERLGAGADIERVREQLGVGDDLGARVTRTFLFTDIVDSTHLAETLGDEAWGYLLRWHDDTVRQAVREHGGSEIKHTGDGFHLAFDSPADALACAVAIQRRFAVHRRSHGFAPHIRIGAHQTEANRTGEDYAGVGVHEAARIAGLAGSGEIVASWDTARAAGDGLRLEGPRSVTVKGISHPIDIARVEWAEA